MRLADSLGFLTRLLAGLALLSALSAMPLSLLAQDHVPQEGATPEALLDSYLAEKNVSKRSELRERILAGGVAARDLVWARIKGAQDEDQRPTLIALLAGFTAEGTAAKLEELARRSADSQSRVTAINGLEQQGAEGIQALSRLLSEPSLGPYRSWILSSLASCDDASVPGILARVLRQESDSEPGLQAARCLVYHDPASAVDPLARMLPQAPPALGACITGFLADFLPHLPGDQRSSVEKKVRGQRSRLIQSLEAGGSEAIEAAEALGVLREPGAEKALRKRLAETPPPAELVAMLWALGQIDAAAGKPVILQLLGAPGAAEATVVPVALRALGRTGDAAVAATIVPYLDHTSEAIRLAAVEALAELGAPEAGPEIAKRLLKNKEGSGAHAAGTAMAHALGRLACPEAVYPLSRLARDKDAKSLASEAIRALAQTPGSAATQELVALASGGELEAADLEVVLGALACRPEPAALEELVACAGRAAQRSALQQALARPEARGHVPALLERLAGSTGAQAGAICRMLGWVGDPRAVEPLLEALDEREARPDAVEALGLLADRRALEDLLAFTTSPVGDLSSRASEGVLRVLEREEPEREPIARRVAEQQGGVAANPLAAEGERARALERLALAAHPAGREAALLVLRSGATPRLRQLAARALASMGPGTEGVQALLKLLPETGAELRLAVLDALVAARDAAVDEEVLRLAAASQDRSLQLEAALYALRCGKSTSTKDLEKALVEGAGVFRAPVHDIHLEGYLFASWLTGEKWPCRHLLPGSVPHASGWRSQGYYSPPPVPPVWTLQLWVEEHRSELEEEAAFAAAVRSDGAGKLRAYLKRYPQGRHVAEAERLVDGGEGR
ncbi:MAG: HEAT repeat domain-containing protein [Planctomycetota bacterium]